MDNPLKHLLEQQTFAVLDGAMATELEGLGADLNDPLWSAKVLIELPELIRQVHLNYLLAGADIITTSTYQATYAGFARRGIDKVASDRLFIRSVELAAEARHLFWSVPDNRVNRRFPLIAASLGPYGAFLADGSEYRGNYGLSEEVLSDWHLAQVSALAQQGAIDFILFETIPELREAMAILRVLEQFPALRGAISFSCRDERHLSGGDRFATAVQAVARHPQLIATGINCTPPEFITSLLQSLEAAPIIPVMVYPNSGEQWDAATHQWCSTASRLSLPKLVGQWVGAGARIIGGCCRIGPEQIKSIRRVLVEAM